MTINDQIEDEKLQYDINREAAKYQPYRRAKFISMSIWLVRKYYHLIKTKNKLNITYSPLGKAFEKQIKTIEDQRKIQIKAIQNQGEIKTINKYAYSDQDKKKKEISKQQEIFKKLVDNRLQEITNLDKKKLILMI